MGSRRSRLITASFCRSRSPASATSRRSTAPWPASRADRTHSMGPILVTGAAGFAGGHLLDLLCNEPAEHDVVAWRRTGTAAAADGKRVRWESVDLLDRTTVASAIDRIRPSFVYHCA